MTVPFKVYLFLYHKLVEMVYCVQTCFFYIFCMSIFFVRKLWDEGTGIILAPSLCLWDSCLKTMWVLQFKFLYILNLWKLAWPYYFWYQWKSNQTTLWHIISHRCKFQQRWTDAENILWYVSVTSKQHLFSMEL